MTIPHYISKNETDVRCIKSGWYAMDHDGNLSSGPFPSHEGCLSIIAQPTNGSEVKHLCLPTPTGGSAAGRPQCNLSYAGPTDPW